MHAHRVEVLDRADDHDVVELVADDLELELAPALDRLLDQHLRDRALVEPAQDDRVELLGRAREAAAVAAERERRADRDGQAELAVERGARLLGRAHDHRLRHAQADRGHRLAERLAVLGGVDRVRRGADQLDPELLEHAGSLELHREVERGLAAQRRQQRVGPLLAQHGGHALEVERLEVGRVGPVRVGHDRRRVGVDQDRAIALLAQHLERLHAGVVELAGLADHDRPGPDDRDRLEIVAPRHQPFPPARATQASTNSDSFSRASCGPGEASGWNCMLQTGRPRRRRPSTVPS